MCGGGVLGLGFFFSPNMSKAKNGIEEGNRILVPFLVVQR